MATLQTTATRPSGSSHADGKAYFETSTNQFIVWDATAGAWIQLDSDGTGAVLYPNRWGASFDGSDDYLTTSPVTPNAQQGTISGWIKVPSSHSGHMPVVTWSILSTSNTYQDRLTVRNGQIRYYHQDSTAGIDIVQGATTGLFDNTWHHVAVVCNGSSYALYLDGSAETVSVVSNSNSGKWIGDITGTHEVTEIGASRRSSAAGGSDYGNGLLDEVAVWDSALSAPDIAKIYNGTAPNGKPTDLTLAASYDTDRTSNLVGYWRMGDDSNDSATSGGPITTITDSSGNGHDATQSDVTKQPTFKALDQSTTSVSFDGTDDYMIAGLDGTASGGVLASNDGDINFTISTWFKPLASGEQQLFQWANMLSASTPFLTITTTKIYLNGGFRLSFSSGDITTNAWNNFILTRTASDNTWRGYVAGNSNPIFTYNDGGSLTHRANAQDIYLGNLYGGFGNVLFDEVAFFNSALSASDVASLASSRGAHIVNDLSLSPVAYYRMGEDDSLTDGQTGISQITDASGNGYHATQSDVTSQPTASVVPIIYA